MKRAFLLLVTLALAGCLSVPPRIWYRDGVSVDSNPTLLASFQRDRTICDGEAAKAALGSQEKDIYTHNKNVNLIFDACLTQKGYIGRAS